MGTLVSQLDRASTGFELSTEFAVNYDVDRHQFARVRLNDGSVDFFDAPVAHQNFLKGLWFVGVDGLGDAQWGTQAAWINTLNRCSSVRYIHDPSVVACGAG